MRSKSVKFLLCLFAVSLFVFPVFLTSCENPAKDQKEPDEIPSTEKTAPGEDRKTESGEKTEAPPAEMPEEETEDNEEKEWRESKKNHSSEEGLLWLIDFINSRPDSRYASEAEELVEKIRGDSSYSEKYLFEPTLELIDEFISKFPGHKDMEKAYELRGDFSGDIHAMIHKGYIAAVAAGDSISRNLLRIQNKTDSKLEVTIPFGTYFAANSGNVQNMLARREKNFSVRAGQSGVLYIDTACMNIYKDTPGESDYFTVEMLAENSQLIKLLKVLDENGAGYEIAQAAIWQAADNPGKEAILGALVYENGKGAITAFDYDEALRLVEAARDSEIIKLGS